MTLCTAKRLAEDAVRLFEPVCERILIAGSVRRGKDNPTDVEIVFEPRFRAEASLFGDDVDGPQINCQMELVERLLAEGTVTKRVHTNGQTTCGAGAQYLWFRGEKLDLFGVIAPSQWGRIATIRTGPKEFNQRIVTQRVQGGTVLKTGQQIKNGALWDCGRMIETPTEESFLKAIGHGWIAPEDRH